MVLIVLLLAFGAGGAVVGCCVVAVDMYIAVVTVVVRAVCYVVAVLCIHYDRVIDFVVFGVVVYVVDGMCCRCC